MILFSDNLRYADVGLVAYPPKCSQSSALVAKMNGFRKFSKINFFSFLLSIFRNPFST